MHYRENVVKKYFYEDGRALVLVKYKIIFVSTENTQNDYFIYLFVILSYVVRRCHHYCWPKASRFQNTLVLVY